MTTPVPPEGGSPVEPPAPQQAVPPAATPQAPQAQPAQPVPPAPPAPPAYGMAPTFAPPAATARHRLGGVLIASIIGGAIVIGGGATAAAVALGGSHHTTTVTPPTPQPNSGTGLLGGGSTGPQQDNPPTDQPTEEATDEPTEEPTQQPTDESTDEPSEEPTEEPTQEPTAAPGGQGDSGGQGISLTDGVTVTPSGGWKVVDHSQDNAVTLQNPDGSAQLFITVGKAQSSDVGSDLAADLQQVSSDISNLQLGQPTSQAVQGDNFSQLAAVQFAGDVSSNQGSGEIDGMAFEFLNTDNGLSEFALLTAGSTDDLKASFDGASTVLGSTE